VRLPDQFFPTKTTGLNEFIIAGNDKTLHVGTTDDGRAGGQLIFDVINWLVVFHAGNCVRSY
jgi:hypothetical protein